MRKLDIALPEKRSIEINGQTYEIQVADAGIMERALQMRDYAKIAPGDDKKIIKAIRDSIGFIDEMLGAGATKKIAEGRPVSLVWAIKVMETVSLEIMKEYGTEVAEEYE